MREMETTDQAISRLKRYASALYKACFQRVSSMVQTIFALGSAGESHGQRDCIVGSCIGVDQEEAFHGR